MPIKLDSGSFDSQARDKNLFYHQCSTNKDFSHKNTEEVLKAFKKFSLDFPSSKFVLTGYMTKKELDLAKDIKNYKIF